MKPYLLDEGAHERTADREGLHDQYQVPVYQGPVRDRVSFLHVKEGVGDGSSEDGDVRQGHGVLRAEPEDEDVDGNQNPAAPDPAGRGDHETKGGQDQRRHVPSGNIVFDL